MSNAVTLEQIIEAAQRPGPNNAPLSQDERRSAIRELFADQPRDVVDAVLNEAIEKFGDLNASDPTEDAELFGLELLVDAMETAREVQGELDAAEQAKAQTRAELAERAAKITEGTEPKGEGEGDDPAADKGKGADATDTGDPAKVAGEGDGEPKDTPKGEGGDGTGAEAEAGAELVTAAAGPRAHFSVGSVKKPAKRTVTEPAENTQGGVKIITAAGNRDYDTGAELAGVTELAAAATARIKGLPTKSRGVLTKADIASLQIQFPDDLVASGAVDDGEVLSRAADMSRLEGGSITAAGGWCAPSTTLYDIPGSLTDANAGMLDVPEINVTRGGIRFRRQIDFGTIYSGGMAGRVMTEAMAESEDEADYTKQFYRVDCPEFSEVRADAVYTGATAGILQNYAYPEEVEAQIAELIAAHAHRINFLTIQRVEALSSNVVNLSGTFGPSAIGAQLNGIEWVIINERYRLRASEGMLFNVGLPIWDKAVIRADIALRSGSGTDVLSVTDEQINAWFSARGARVTWLYDWQDALANAGAGVGSTATPTAYPTTVKALIYPEGTFVRGRGDIINIEAVYDSVGLQTNDFLRLFMEEQLLVAHRAHRGSVVNLPLGVNGITGAPRNLDGNGKVAA